MTWLFSPQGRSATIPLVRRVDVKWFQVSPLTSLPGYQRRAAERERNSLEFSRPGSPEIPKLDLAMSWDVGISILHTACCCGPFAPCISFALGGRPQALGHSTSSRTGPDGPGFVAFLTGPAGGGAHKRQHNYLINQCPRPSALTAEGAAAAGPAEVSLVASLPVWRTWVWLRAFNSHVSADRLWAQLSRNPGGPWFWNYAGLLALRLETTPETTSETGQHNTLAKFGWMGMAGRTMQQSHVRCCSRAAICD